MQFSLRKLLLGVAAIATACVAFQWTGFGGIIALAIGCGVAAIIWPRLDADPSLAVFASLCAFTLLLSAANAGVVFLMLIALWLVATVMAPRGGRGIRSAIAVVALISIIPCGFAACSLAYNLAYWHGQRSARDQLAEGMCQIAVQRRRMGRYCIVFSPFDVGYSGYLGECAGFGSQLPPGCGSPEYAERRLKQLGAMFKPLTQGAGRSVSFPAGALANKDLESLVILSDIREWNLSGQSGLDDGCLKYLELACRVRQVESLIVYGTKISFERLREFQQIRDFGNPPFAIRIEWNRPAVP